MKVKGENYSFSTSRAYFYLRYTIENGNIQLYISTCIHHSHISGECFLSVIIYSTRGLEAFMRMIFFKFSGISLVSVGRVRPGNKSKW